MPIVSHNQKSDVAPQFNHLDLRNAMVPLAICHSSSNDLMLPENGLSHLISVFLTWGMQGSNLWYCWYHVILISIPVTSHDQKSHLHLFLSSWPKQYSGAIYDAVGIMWHQKVMLFLILLSWPKEYNDVSENADGIVLTTVVSMAWHDQKSDVELPFQSSWSKKCKGAIDDAISITCCLCHFHWEHMTKNILQHYYFNHFDIRNAAVPLMMPLAWMDTDTTANGITWPSCTSFQLC